MWRLARNEILGIKAYHNSLHTSCSFSQVKAYITFLMDHVWLFVDFQMDNMLNVFNPNLHSNVKRLDVKGQIKLIQKHNIEVKIKCVMRNE